VRRYALFTLVGIAGEDDLDAPDIIPSASQASVPEKPAGNSNGQMNGGKHFPIQRMPHRRAGIQPSSPSSLGSVLATDQSAEMRNRLVAEVNELDSGDNAALWAHRNIAAKKRLTAADAQLVEDAFRTKLESFAS
jgi:hypothetical protein